MSANTSVLRARFLSRSSSGFSVLPLATKVGRINYTTDVRQCSASFDFEVEYTAKDSIDLKSHDFVEFYTEIDGVEFQIGVGFIEVLMRESGPSRTVFRGNGRNLMGQLLGVPFKTRQYFEQITFPTFVAGALKERYIAQYAAFRGLKQSIVEIGSYGGTFTIIGDQFRKIADVLQEYAELAINLLFLNRIGQVVILGRDESAAAPAPVGTICHGPKISNVSDLVTREDFTNVASSCTVFWTSNQKAAEESSVTSDFFKNTNPRVAHVDMPRYLVFSADDLVRLSGGVSASQRVSSIAKSEIRRSNQNVLSAIATCAEPFVVDPSSGKKIPFEQLQYWRVLKQADSVDEIMQLAGISYRQDAGRFDAQLSFVLEDTLV